VGIEATIIDATQEIFASMVMLGATPGSAFERADEPLLDSVSGVVSLTGKYSGLLALHFPVSSAMDVAGAFLDLELEEIDADVLDAIGELTNMLAGNIKAELDPSGSQVQLSIPSTFHGDEYRIERIAGTANICIPFYLDYGDFQVELQLKS